MFRRRTEVTPLGSPLESDHPRSPSDTWLDRQPTVFGKDTASRRQTGDAQRPAQAVTRPVGREKPRSSSGLSRMFFAIPSGGMPRKSDIPMENPLNDGVSKAKPGPKGAPHQAIAEPVDVLCMKFGDSPPGRCVVVAPVVGLSPRGVERGAARAGSRDGSQTGTRSVSRDSSLTKASQRSAPRGIGHIAPRRGSGAGSLRRRGPRRPAEIEPPRRADRGMIEALLPRPGVIAHQSGPRGSAPA